jgi:hypothetical protein
MSQWIPMPAAIYVIANLCTCYMMLDQLPPTPKNLNASRTKNTSATCRQLRKLLQALRKFQCDLDATASPLKACTLS